MKQKPEKALIADLSSAHIKIQKLANKIADYKVELSEVRSDRRYLRKRIKALESSRSAWKSKSQSNGLKYKELKKNISRKEKAKRHQYDLWLVNLCCFLRTYCGIDYRKIVKVLKMLSIVFQLELIRIPSANSVQNWVSKWGLYHLESVGNQIESKEVCLIIDESIRLGNQRLLLCLACEAIKHSSSSLTYESVSVCYINSASSWSGADIQSALSKVAHAQSWEIAYIVSDGASNLKKTADLLGVFSVPDISHAIGHCLRKTFAKSEKYKAFSKLLGTYQYKGVHQKLSYLLPPKQRKKARFMNQKPQVQWACTLLNKWSYLQDKEAEFFADLKAHKAIIDSLKTCIDLGQSFACILKKEGLTQQSLEKGLKHLAQKDSCQDEYVKIFISYLMGYINVYQAIVKKDGRCFHACSDIIESMFGTYKEKVSQNPLIGLSLLSLEIPLWGKDKKAAPVKKALEDIFMADLDQWRKNKNNDNQALRRAKFFKK